MSRRATKSTALERHQGEMWAAKIPPAEQVPMFAGEPHLGLATRPANGVHAAIIDDDETARARVRLPAGAWLGAICIDDDEIVIELRGDGGDRPIATCSRAAALDLLDQLREALE